MSGYLGTKAVTLSTTTASVGGDSTVGGDLTVDTNTLYVDSTNNQVGIATSSPNHTLDVKAATGNGISITPTAGNATNYISWYDTGGGPYGRIGYDHSASAMMFTTVTSERMRIDSSGNLRVGNTGGAWPAVDGVILLQEGILQASLNNSASLYLNRGSSDGNIAQFARSGTTVGGISVTSSSTSFNTSSDYRLKENVTDVTDGITRVKQLEPKRFNFIADPDTTVDGFLAHQAQAVVPEAVTGTHNEVDDDGNAVMQGIDQSKLVPLLTAALKEAITKIETLETEMTSVKARLDALEGN